MLIYSEYDSPRFRYAAGLLLADCAAPWEVTYERNKFDEYSGPKIFYGEKNIPHDVLTVVSVSLLWTNERPTVAPAKGEWDELPTLFPVRGKIPFDIFSAVFFLVSRYEEYNTRERDELGRFPAVASLSHQHGFLRLPIVDLWRKKFNRLLGDRWPALILNETTPRFLATVDVDSAFAYNHKGFGRTLGGFLRDLAKGRPVNMLRRLKALVSGKDPFDTYGQITAFALSQRIDLAWFFLLADFSRYDINVPYKSPALRSVIRELSARYRVGIHPGMASNSSPMLLKREKQRLEEITGKRCSISRQHFLMLEFPDTYKNLLDAGINEDFSMGYADDIGFRAGTCRPFYWYDLYEDRVSNLIVHSVAVMDSTLKTYLRLTPDQAIEVSTSMMETVADAGGEFVSLWHNETVAEQGGWKNWRKVWEETLERAAHIFPPQA